jgi:hypothetical protein
MITATKTLATRAFFLLAGLVLCTSAQGAAVNTKGQDLVPTGKGWGELPDPGRNSKELADFPELGAFAGKRIPKRNKL